MRRLLVAGLAALALAACGGNNDALVDLRLFAMGTWVDLRLPRAATTDHPELIATIEAELRQFERDYYPWTEGELARLNAALTATGRFEASPALADLVAFAADIARATNGAFDPGVGGLVELWGFNDGADLPQTPPTDAAIQSVLAAAGSIRDLTIEGTAISADTGTFTLDLGGIAKGAIVDTVIGQLAALAISPALVNAGGDLRVVGAPPDRAWRIGVQAPRGDGLLGTIALASGEAAFSSGDYERFYEHDGERLHHILDPRTGRPVTHTEAVTVLAADGRTADAAATALFVAGPDAWRAMAATLGIEAVLRVDASGAIEMTPAMRDRFQPSASAASDIIAGVR
jgi:thiamine biosynthesis lipoprotein